MSDNRNLSYNVPPKNSEFDFGRLVQVLAKRKWILLVSLLVFIVVALVYNTITKPIYESSVLMKKETAPKNDNSRDELKDILTYQSSNVIETELELVKTNEVLEKIANKFSLFFTVKSLDKVNGSKGEIDLGMAEYNQKYFNDGVGSGYFPKFTDIKLKTFDKSFNFLVKKKNNTDYDLFNDDNGQYITEGKNGLFITENIDFHVDWPKASPGKTVSVSVNNFYKTVQTFSKNIDLEQKAKTDVFIISVRTGNPFTAQMLANALAEQYRETRIEQQKDNIRYSYDFVDKNLEDIHAKLKEAEDELTDYKAANHIMDLGGSSEDLVRFLSNVEAEKMNTDLELTQYQNKISKMDEELKQKGFFDQTYLSPQNSDPNNSPFSAVMKQLSDLELKRLDLLQKRTVNHPDVVNIDEQIKQVKAKLESYNENTLTSYNIIQNSLQKKRDQLSALSNKYEAKMQTLPGKENKLASLTRQRDVFARMYTLLLDKREEMRMAELTKLQDVIIADYADLPQIPVTPRKLFNLIGAFILGNIFGLLFIFVVEVRSKRLISLDDIEDDFNMPIFAIIPNYSKEIVKKIENSVLPEERFVVLGKEQDGFKESFRVLRTKISGEADDKKQVILFTSGEEDTGKTTIVSNLALSIAQANKKILIVDCDLRKGTLSRLFDFKLDDPGLLTYLKGKLDLPHIYNRVSESLYILPSGGVSENSSDLLASNKMSDLVAYLNDSFYDYIIFDTPPVNYVVDTLVLGKLIKDVIMVIRPNHSFKESVKYGVKEMSAARMNIRGCVINAGEIEKSVFKYRYGYGYGYKYGYGDNNILKKKKAKS